MDLLGRGCGCRWVLAGLGGSFELKKIETGVSTTHVAQGSHAAPDQHFVAE